MMIYWVLGGLTVVLATVAVWAVCAVGGGSDAHIEMIEEQKRTSPPATPPPAPPQILENEFGEGSLDGGENDGE